MASNTEYKSWLSSEDETIISLEKAQAGRTTLDDIADAIDEYKRLFVAGLASPAEKITLHRAFPSDVEYMEACEALKNDDGDYDMMIVGGPASVEVVDREGHLITTDALKKAFKKYMKNFRGRNVMVMHSDVQVGHALPAYISKSGNIFKSGVDDKGLFFIAELRDDTKISGRVRDQIEKGGMKSYSIAGSATQSKQINKSDGSTILQVDDMELAEVTICEKGVNQNAHFELLKGDKAEGSCVDGSCLTKSHDPAPDYNIVAISKSEIPSFKDMFTSWIAKEQDSDKSTAIAIATAQAKKMGYKKFTEGSPGDKKRDKLAKEIKRSLKSAKEKAITKTFLSKQPEPPKGVPREYLSFDGSSYSIMDEPQFTPGGYDDPETFTVDPDKKRFESLNVFQSKKPDTMRPLKISPSGARAKAEEDEGGAGLAGGPFVQEPGAYKFGVQDSRATGDSYKNPYIYGDLVDNQQASITKQLFLDKLKEIV